MVDPVIEDFGAGLESQIQPPVQQTSPSGDLLAEMRTRLAGLPEDMTYDSFADRVVDIQAKADKAAELEIKLAALEAERAQFVASQVAAPVESAAGIIPSAKQRRYEARQIDPDLAHLVTPDPEGRGYVPKNAMNPAHISAAQQMNEAAAVHRRVANDFTADPYGTTAELVRELLEERDAKWEARIGEVSGKLTPLEQHYANQQKAVAENQIIAANESKLYAEDGAFTPLGAEVDFIMRKYKVPVEQAIADAEEKLGMQAPPAAPAKSISRVAKPPEAPTSQRFIDRLSGSTRALTERPDSGESHGKKNPSVSDLRKAYLQPTNDNN